MSLVDKAVHQAIFDSKDDEWSTEGEGRYACVNNLRAEDAVYYVHYSSNFQTGKGNPKKKRYAEKTQRRYNCRQRKCVSQNHRTYRFLLR